MLFDRAVGHLRTLGCRSISLDAVPRAVAFYESRGFRPVARSLRFRGRIPARLAEGVRPMTPADLGAVAELDRQSFGQDRKPFLRRRLELAPELAWLRTAKTSLAGYIFGRRRPPFAWAGPWWSDPIDPNPAALLAAFAAGAGEVDICAGVLESNARALAVLSSLGFRRQPRPSLRMTLGPGETPGSHPSLLAIGTAAKG